MLSFFTLTLPEEAKKIEIFPKFQIWMKNTNIFKCKPPEVHFSVRDSPYCHDLGPISGTALVLTRLVSGYGLTVNSPPPVIVFGGLAINCVWQNSK